MSGYSLNFKWQEEISRKLDKYGLQLRSDLPLYNRPEPINGESFIPKIVGTQTGKVYMCLKRFRDYF